MTWFVVIVLCLGPVVIALHLVLLWMERRGWIYYWHKSGSAGMGNVLMPLQTIMQPEYRHTIEERARQHVDNEDAGDPLP